MENIEEEKNKNAWKKFQEKMQSLKMRQHSVLVRISEKVDRQYMEKLRKKIQKHE
jgi:hypothetical protein